ncbi:hypothetical protein [Nocardioides sp.]|uniref:hypothetical protein n=1 Tax=Nocardioides sp. TaxID=35761 RepID=UPI0031FE5FAE
MLSPLHRLLVRALAALLFAGCCVFFTSVPALARDCATGTTQMSTKGAKAVYTGTVTTAVSKQKAGGQRGATITHDVTVDRVYKGDISSPHAKVETSSAGGGSSCGLGKLTVGKQYMFFVQGDPSLWTAERGSGTAPATGKLVAQVVRLLGDGRPPTPPAPPQAVFTNVSDGEPESLTRAAAPGVALVLIGLLGLIVVRRVGRAPGRDHH